MSNLPIFDRKEIDYIYAVMCEVGPDRNRGSCGERLAER
jgi:hypothetical protein